MPKGHPYSKEELVMRKRARAKGGYQVRKQREKISQLEKKIEARCAFARKQGKKAVPWSVAQELELIYEYRHTCAFCDMQVDELDLTSRDEQADFCIENMLPICYTCLVDKYTVNNFPQQIIHYIPISELPEGFNKTRLLMICGNETIRVHVVARLRKHNFEALIGLPIVILDIKPEFRGQVAAIQSKQYAPQAVFQHGERLFEMEARALFPEYKSIPYQTITEKRVWIMKV